MPQSEPVTILLVSEQGEVIKVLTLGLRGFFPGCNVEVVYSADEARTWTSAHEWTLILIDEECLAGAHASLPGELKLRAPYAAIILHSDRTDSASAIHARHADVDFFSRSNRPPSSQNFSSVPSKPSKHAIWKSPWTTRRNASADSSSHVATSSTN